MKKINSKIKCNTSNMTGRHRGPKQKLRASYREPSLQRTSFTQTPSLQHMSYSLSSGVESHVFSALGVYSKFQHHPHPLGCFVPNFVCFAASIAELAPWRKTAYSITHSVIHSITQLIRCPGNWSLCFAKCSIYSLWHALSVAGNNKSIQQPKHSIPAVPSSSGTWSISGK